MYAALDQTKKLVNAVECNGEGKYFCPKCSLPVELAMRNEQPFFRHVSCRFNQQNERQIHKLGKNLLAQAFEKANCAQVKVEVYLEKIDQTPDILINDNLAIEYQCAKINVRKLSSRVSSYQKIGLKNIWILGGDYLKRRLTRLHLKYLSYRTQWGFYILMFDPKIKQLMLFYEVRFQGPFNKIVYQKKTFSITQLTDLLNFQPDFKPADKMKISPYQIERVRRTNNGNVKIFKLKFYQRNHQQVEKFLEGKTFGSIKPIYHTHQWMIVCGLTKKRLRQPLLGNPE